MVAAGSGAATVRGPAPDTVAVAFRIPDPELIPEGIAYDPVAKSFFVSSTWKRKVVRVDSLGRASDFTEEGRAGLGGDDVEWWVEIPRSPNGIDLSADGRFLFVAQRGRVGRIDVGTREVVLLETAPDVPMEGMDGLYVHGGDVVVVGGVGEGAEERWFVGRYQLLARHGALRQPTTGVIVGEAIYVVANSQLQHFRALVEADRAAATEELDDPVILRVPLERPAAPRGSGSIATACKEDALEIVYVANEGFFRPRAVPCSTRDGWSTSGAAASCTWATPRWSARVTAP